MKYSKGSEIFISLCFGMLQIYFKKVSAEGANMCGTPEADPEKTCVSIRLPWQPEPIYFCVEKDKVKYKKQCAAAHFGSTHLCGNENRETTLLLATPWDCCPLSSIPDPCENAQCAPMPFNRTCTSLQMPAHDFMDCCGKYFCENGTQEDCKFKLLEPECSSPKNKTNCVAFIDPHGCCSKYQCDGDGKAGVCPTSTFTNFSTSDAYPGTPPRRHRMGETPEGDLVTESSVSSTPPLTESDASLASPEGTQPKVASLHDGGFSSRYGAPPDRLSYSSLTSCVGDYTCPGNMKCCSTSHLYGYGDHPHVGHSIHAVSGYCFEPVAE